MDGIASSIIRRALVFSVLACAVALAMSLGIAPEALSRSLAKGREALYATAWTPAAEAARAPLNRLPQGIRVPSYSPGPIPFHPGEQLVYQASWIGIPAASGLVLLRNDEDADGMLSAEIWISTNRLTDKFYRMRDYLREDFGASSLKPAEMNIRQNESRRHDTFQVTFDYRDHLVTMVKHGPRGAQVRKFVASNPSGPISGAIMALSQPLQRGEVLKFDAFSGTTRYVFELKVVKREKIGTPLGEFDALRIVPSVSYLSDGKLNDEVHDTTLWVSADARRLPLRVESAVFIGSVRIDLVKIVDNGTTRAARD